MSLSLTSLGRRHLLACACALLSAAAVAEGPPAMAAGTVPDEAVTVVRQGGGFTVDAVMQVAVTPAEAYAVLVDFEHMTAYVPHLHLSQVLQRSPHGLTVRQQGTVQWGLFSVKLDSTRELQLSPPSEIRAHALGGSFKRMVSHTQLLALPDGGTQIRYHAEGEPGDWFPPLVGPAVVRRQTAAQFSAMLAEMLRRRAGEPPPRPAGGAAP